MNDYRILAWLYSVQSVLDSEQDEGQHTESAFGSNLD
jgi:hypothetical protein